ncbi:MAG: hypothetical protein ACRD0H_01450, partial [Actinomycetes bacterium]
PALLAGGLLVLAELLNRHGELDASQATLAEAHPLLVAEGEPWGIGAHDIFVARNLAALGQTEEAEAMARAGVERLRASGEHWMILYGLGMQAGLQESRGNLVAAADAYEELLNACRKAKMTQFESMWLIRLAALRARLGDDVAAERLFAASIANSRRWANPAALIGRAGAARRLGDLASCRRWLGEAEAAYDAIGLPAGSTAALIALVWWSLAAGDPAGAQDYAEQARRRAAQAADPLVSVLAETVVAAVALAASDTEVSRTRFASVLERRAGASQSAAFLEGTLDEPDVEALAAAHGVRPV